MVVEARAVLVALGGGMEIIEDLAQEVAHRAFLDPRPALGPIGLHHPSFGHLHLDEKAVLLPESLDDRPDLFGRLLHHEPALRARALDPYTLDYRQHHRCAGCRSAGRPPRAGSRRSAS